MIWPASRRFRHRSQTKQVVVRAVGRRTSVSTSAVEGTRHPGVLPSGDCGGKPIAGGFKRSFPHRPVARLYKFYRSRLQRRSTRRTPRKAISSSGLQRESGWDVSAHRDIFAPIVFKPVVGSNDKATPTGRSAQSRTYRGVAAGARISRTGALAARVAEIIGPRFIYHSTLLVITPHAFSFRVGSHLPPGRNDLIPTLGEDRQRIPDY